MKRVLSLVLALVMLGGLLPGSAFALEQPTAYAQAQQETEPTVSTPQTGTSAPQTSPDTEEAESEPSALPSAGPTGQPLPSEEPQGSPAPSPEEDPQGSPAPSPQTSEQPLPQESPSPSPSGTPEPASGIPPSAEPEEETAPLQSAALFSANNLAYQKPVTASGSEGDYLPENAVDGSMTTRWASGYMKPLWADQQIDDTYQQTPSWLVVDLGQPASLERISIQFHSRTWPTTYRIQTSDDPSAPEEKWETLATVVRPSADTANVLDEFNADELSDTFSKRYLRLYFERVNTFAKMATGTSIFELSVEGAGRESTNLAQDRPVTVSGCENASFPGENMVDGNMGTKWSTAKMKEAGPAGAGQPQTPQWAIIDLGRSGLYTTGMNLYFLEKCWPMEYKIQTSDDPNCAEDAWETLYTMSRPGENKTGQTDNLAPSDLSSAVLKRYVRFYIEKTNESFWSSMSIAEFEILGLSTDAPQTAKSVLKKIEGLAPVTGETAQLALPEVPEGFTAQIIGSSVKNVISQSGGVSPLVIGERTVDVVLKITNNEDPNDTAQKSFAVTVPQRLGGGLFPAVVQPNPQPAVIPSLQEWYGYEQGQDFTLGESSRIVYQDTAGVGLEAVARSMAADLAEFTGLNLQVAAGSTAGPQDIYLESLTQDDYFTGGEGYLMTAGPDGLKIYSSARTGCFYGTITAMQILWQAADHRTIPAGVIRDYPNYEIRGVMLDVGRFPLRMEFLQDYAKILSWYKLNEYHLHLNDNRWAKDTWSGNINDWYDREDADSAHRLESKTFPGLKPLNEPNNEYYNNIYKETFYTQEEYIQLQKDAMDRGINILSELDTPSHAFAYSKYCLENPDNLTEFGDSGVPFGPIHRLENLAEFALEGMGNDENAVRAKAFITELLEEYINPDAPVFLNSEVGIGVDEYLDKKTPEAFRKYIVYLDELLKQNGKTARMWGALALFPGKTEIPTDIVIDHWTTGEEDPVARMREGFRLVNVAQPYLYMTPGRWHKDFLNSEYLFKEWDPTRFSPTVKVDSGDPNLLGAKVAMWGDEALDGMLEADISERLTRAAAILSEKTWGGTKQDASYVEYEQTFDRLREGPGTHIAMTVESQSEVVLEYDFAKTQSDGTVPDLSGNGYDASIAGAQFVTQNGATFASFDGTTRMETPLRSLKYPYTLSFEVKAGANDPEASLFSGYDGRIQAAGNQGQLSVNRSFYDQALGYTLPQDETARITLVGTFQSTRLYVNGKLVKYLYTERADGNSSAGGASHAPINGSGEYHTSIVLPLEQIGKGFHGQLANIKLYNKALDPELIADELAGQRLTGEVNVAVNTLAYAEHFQTGEDKDRTRRKSRPAWKAVDGDFTDPTSSLARTTSPYAAWRSSASDRDYLLLDLGQLREVSRVQILWEQGHYAGAYDLMISQDGQSWTTLQQVSGNSAAQTEHAFATPVPARYVKVQGVSRAAGYYGVEEVKVFEKIDKTNLAALYSQIETILSRPSAIAGRTPLEQAALQARATLQNPVAPVRSIAQTEQAAAAALETWENEQQPTPTPVPTQVPKPDGGSTPAPTSAPAVQPTQTPLVQKAKGAAEATPEKAQATPAPTKTPAVTPAPESEGAAPTEKPASQPQPVQPESGTLQKGGGFNWLWVLLPVLVLLGGAAVWYFYRKKQD